MAGLIAVAVVMLPVAAGAQPAADPAAVAAMEREFAAYAAEHGWVEAFRRYSAPDGQMAGPGGIATVAASLDGAPAGDRSLAWWPRYAGIAQSGDLGFTTGTFSIDAARTPRGQYFTVWKRQPDGYWRWIFDGGPGSVLDPAADGPSGAAIPALPVAIQGAGSAAEAVRQVQALEAGIATAADLAKHLAADARVYRRQRARAEGGAASVENTRYPDPGIRYRLVRAEASAAGDLAFTLGDARWQAGDVARAGAFARLWQYRDDRWVIVYDQLVEQPPPQPAAAGAATQTGAAAMQAGCAGPEFHALDFWIGHWRVETPKREHAGASHVETVLSGCVLLEHWKGIFLTTGQVHEGLGVHRYDAAARTWRQAWVDETGGSLDMTGEADAGGVTYHEPDPGDGSTPRGRVARLGDRQVEQYAERKDPATGAWSRTFHLVYSPASEASAPPAPPAPGACGDDARRALDFWIGRWRVTTAAGQPVGRNRIEPALSGCALLEHWRGYSPELGREQDGLGVHRYDAATGTWRQAWMVDNGGGYDLVGRAQADGVVYERRDAEGRVAGRTTLTKRADGSVRQLGERRDPASGAWQVAFDFIYVREP
jgi:ketosteroid isomerase-like protein